MNYSRILSISTSIPILVIASKHTLGLAGATSSESLFVHFMYSHTSGCKPIMRYSHNKSLGTLAMISRGCILDT